MMRLHDAPNRRVDEARQLLERLRPLGLFLDALEFGKPVRSGRIPFLSDLQQPVEEKHRASVDLLAGMRIAARESAEYLKI